MNGYGIAVTEYEGVCRQSFKLCNVRARLGEYRDKR